jgi:hypothetical protein
MRLMRLFRCGIAVNSTGPLARQHGPWVALSTLHIVLRMCVHAMIGLDLGRLTLLHCQLYVYGARILKMPESRHAGSVLAVEERTWRRNSDL